MKFDLAIHTADPVHVQVERFLRHKIQTGELAPGQKLPPTGELARLWHVDRTAIQRAVAPLVAQGLIERSPKRGTFVKAATEKAVIAVLCGPSLADESAHFYRALLGAFRSEALQHKWVCRLYDGLNPVHDPALPHHEEALRHLRHDVANCGFKGFIHIALRWELTQALERELGGPVTRWNPDREATDLRYDNYQFARNSVTYLAGKGRRRLAFVYPSAPPGLKTYPAMDGFWDETRARGLPQPEIAPLPCSGVGSHFEAEMQEAMARKMRDWRSRPQGLPEGLVVSDDVVMRGVALALITAGIKVPDEMAVVTLANDGVRLHYGAPVTRYEFSTGEAAKEMLGLLWKRIVREPLPPRPIVLRGKIREPEMSNPRRPAVAGRRNQRKESRKP